MQKGSFLRLFCFKNMTISQKLMGGFSCILLILVICGLFAFFGIRTIVSNAQEVIYGNTLDGIMAQKEVDHLNWVSKVNSLLNNEVVTQLEVETDDHKCGFGKWLYSDSRKEAEQRVSGLGSILLALEEPHHRLHNSAIEIDKVFVQADPKTPGIIADRKIDHLRWAAQIRDTFLSEGTGKNFAG